MRPESSSASFVHVPSSTATAGGSFANDYVPFTGTADWTTLSSVPSTGLTSFGDSSFKPLFNQDMVPAMNANLSSVEYSDSFPAISGSLPMSTTTTNSTIYASSNQSGGQDYLPTHSNASASPDSRDSPSDKSSTKGSSTNTRSGNDPGRIEKRKQNTLAARRYRQKRVDQMNSLESTLKEVKSERDSLRVRCARLEGEVEVLRQLLRSQGGRS